MGKPCLVITSIAGPTPSLRALAAAARSRDFDFVLIGDEPSPARFALDGCDFYGLDRQRALPFAFAHTCPVRSYARKNIGYLLAMRRGAPVIVEADDDSVAYPRFWQPDEPDQTVKTVAVHGWVNVYRYFTDAGIWPRGLPLDHARAEVPHLDALPVERVTCPIQQGVVDDDPDVDAVYRMLVGEPRRFEYGQSVALADGAWCPFNSQNTTWWPDAYPLMYLPAFCSFRMTDIWRSFVAQRLAWENGWAVLHHGPTASHSRNTHDLLRDFEQEVPGYLANDAIRAALEELELEPGAEQLARNMRVAYERLVAGGWLDEAELPLLDAWLADVRHVESERHSAVG